MKEKVYIVETARRAWLMNIINFYGLLFILPYYILPGIGILYVLIYMLTMATVGAFASTKLSVYLTRKFCRELTMDIVGGNILPIAYRALYGFAIPFVSLIFIPIIITTTLVIDAISVSILFKLMVIFIIDLILVFIFVYKNIRIVNVRINEILRYLRSRR